MVGRVQRLAMEPGRMKRQMDYSWRLLATSGSFAAFGLGALTLSMIVFPPLLLIPCRQRRARQARWLIHKTFGFFMWSAQALRLMRFHVENRAALERCGNVLVLANHPTLIDVVALISLMPAASCVVKQALWRNPFLGGVVKAADYISNATPDALIDDCTDDLATGHPLIIFPEGTRSEPGKPLRFLRGASYIALHSRRPILPVLITCTPTTLTKREKWYQIPHRRFDLRVKILPQISIEQLTDTDSTRDAPALAARRLTQALESHFTEQLKQYG